MKLKRKHLGVLGAVAVVGVAYAATQLQIQLKDEQIISNGGSGHKPKIQRAGSNGNLVMAYGDTFDAAPMVYDTKAQAERKARDIFVRYCTPTPETDTTTTPRITCDVESEWSPPVNVSRSADKTSIQTAWQAGGTTRLPFYGDIDKPNIKTSGPVMVLTWVSKYCPDGDLSDNVVAADNTQNPNQRAIRYLDRENRIIPFSCTWMAASTNNGVTWRPAVQLSNGERDAKQDASSGNYNSTAATGRINISWQEDPEGLQPGDADGPGDGASGANVTGGTDVWYTYADIASGALTFGPGDGSARAKAYRVTDNWDGLYGLSGQISHVFAADGTNLDGKSEAGDIQDDGSPSLIDQRVEKGNAGGSRPNIFMVGPTTVLAWEETKGSQGLDSGKFVRYLNFTYSTPPSAVAGCVISNPLKNARRVRFLTQDGSVASPGGVNIAIFWKEGLFDKGGPSDIVVRRGMGGLSPANMQPAVDGNCATSDYPTAIGLANALPENISSRAPFLTATDNGLGDGTEVNYAENALAHRGVLRGDELWIGYNYTNDLVKMWAQQDNYNFWVRKYTFDGTTGTGSWALPYNITNVTDTRINVREPRFFGTPPSNPTACPTGDPTDVTTTNPTLCQDRNMIFVAYGSQTNVSPFDPNGPEDLGIYLTASRDSGLSFIPSVEYSKERGSLFDDEDYAFEAQLVARPDGKRVYGTFNTENVTGSAAAYRSADILEVDDTLPTIQVLIDSDGNDVPDLLVTFTYDPSTDSITESSGSLADFPMKGNVLKLDGTVSVNGEVTDGLEYEFPQSVTTDPVTTSSGGGCTAADGQRPVDPTLPLFAALGLLGWGLRRARRN